METHVDEIADGIYRLSTPVPEIGPTGFTFNQFVVEADESQAEDIFGATCVTPQTAPTIRRLADLEPATLAIMHGSSYHGDAAKALLEVADRYETRLEVAAARE